MSTTAHSNPDTSSSRQCLSRVALGSQNLTDNDVITENLAGRDLRGMDFQVPPTRPYADETTG